MHLMNSTSTAWESLSPAERSQVLLLRHVGLPVIERVQRMPVGRHLPELERSQWVAVGTAARVGRAGQPTVDPTGQARTRQDQ